LNYLAHFYLSFGQENLVVGNLLGDFVRGNLHHPRNAAYSEAIKTGIQLHRHIDTFTDEHPVVRACRKQLRPQFGLYSGVVIDMYFDYFLASRFAEFSTTPLRFFAANVYEILAKNRAVLPPEAFLLVESMTKYDWLTNYQYAEGMRRSFGGMSRRFEFLKGIENADEELFENETQYLDFFQQFFPDLVTSCRQKVEN
jgi:acyl carrier protein phosphodiesterase